MLYGKRALLEAMPPFLGGGDMVDTVTFAKTTYAPVPLKFEAGTANFTGAIALGEAVKFVGRFDPAEVEAHEAALLHRASERLTAVDGRRIYGTTPGKCPIVSFNVEGVHPYDMGMILDKLGIAVRTGQHCAEPTMTHFSTTGMCRASFALYNTLAEADALAGGVERAVRMLRAAAVYTTRQASFRAASSPPTTSSRAESSPREPPILPRNISVTLYWLVRPAMSPVFI